MDKIGTRDFKERRNQVRLSAVKYLLDKQRENLQIAENKRRQLLRLREFENEKVD